MKEFRRRGGRTKQIEGCSLRRSELRAVIFAHRQALPTAKKNLGA
jgi:hypothetical protein